MRGRLSSVSVAATVAVAVMLGTAHAVDIRDPRIGTVAFFRLVRAYAPCLVPNDQATDGSPACSPPVSSPCEFTDATVKISAPHNGDLDTVELRARVGGQGNCRDGQYSLRFVFRVTADDAACTGGTCTFEDLTASKSFTHDPRLEFDLAELAPAGFDQANLEIKEVAIYDPDGIPLATTGVREERLDLSRVESNLTLAYDECEDPTSGPFNAGCAPPARAAVCDYDHASVEWRGNARKGLLWKAEAKSLVGGPECADGTYHLVSTLRITTRRCGDGTLPCTLVDTPIDFPIVVKKGRLKRKLVTPGVSLPRDHVEIHDVRLVEPGGSTLATTGVGHAPRLQKTKILVARGGPNDDKLRVKAAFPTKKIDPTAAGVTFTVRDREGVAYTATIPGDLWQHKRGSSFVYDDKAKSIAGIRRATVSRGKLTLAAFGRDLSAADQPSQTLEITIASPLGGGPTKATQNRSCRVKASGLICR